MDSPGLQGASHRCSLAVRGWHDACSDVPMTFFKGRWFVGTCRALGAAVTRLGRRLTRERRSDVPMEARWDDDGGAAEPGSVPQKSGERSPTQP